MRVIPIFYETLRVAEISVSDVGDLSLSYDRRWLNAKGTFPISLTLPLQDRSFGPEVFHPWISNLLPEERPLDVLARGLGLSKMDSLAILEKIGGDTAGAFAFGEPTLAKEWDYIPLVDFYGCDTEQQALQRHFQDLQHRPFLLGEGGVRLSLAGGQQKSALAVVDKDGRPKLGLPGPDDQIAVPRHGAPSTVIIKPDNPHLEGIVENEAFCLTLAGEIGLSTSPVTVLSAIDRTALAIARYDREQRPGGSLRRLHQEDFAQILGVYPTNKYERGTVRGPSLKDILTAGNSAWTLSRSAPAGISASERLHLVDQLIFNILVANSDAHAKNYSVLLDAEGARISPLYDVSCVLIWDHVNQYFAQNIAGRKRRPGNIALRHWSAIARDAGFNTRQIRMRVEEMVDAIVRKGHDAANKVSSLPGVQIGVVERVRDLVEQNALRILGRFKLEAELDDRPQEVTPSIPDFDG